MPSSPAPSEPVELELRPSAALAVVLILLVTGAIAALLASALPAFLLVPLMLLALASGLVSVRGAMRPGLRIRLLGDCVEYRSDQRAAWCRLQTGRNPCFVSPWYIGWYGRRGRGHGVFRGQLEPDEFRRLAACLRNQGQT